MLALPSTLEDILLGSHYRQQHVHRWRAAMLLAGLAVLAQPLVKQPARKCCRAAVAPALHPGELLCTGRAEYLSVIASCLPLLEQLNRARRDSAAQAAELKDEDGVQAEEDPVAAAVLALSSDIQAAIKRDQEAAAAAGGNANAQHGNRRQSQA